MAQVEEIDQPRVGIAGTGRLRDSRDVADNGEEPRACAPVVAAAVDLDIDGRGGSRVDLEVDRAALVDALRRRIALDAAGGPTEPSAWLALFALLAAGVFLGPLALWWSSMRG